MRLVIAIVGLVLGSCGSPSPEADDAASDHRSVDTLTVLAAASTTEFITRAAAIFTRETGITVHTGFGATSTLARQIEAGAPADVFLAADRAWMDRLEAGGHLRAGSRCDLLDNVLVIVVPVGSRAATTSDARSSPAIGSSGGSGGGSGPRSAGDGVEVGAGAGGGGGGVEVGAGDKAIDWTPGAPVPGVFSGRIAIGDPDHVPAGRYAARVMDAMGWRTSVASRLLAAPDVRGALRYVELGEADAGFVYRSDAMVTTRVRVVAIVPSNLTGPIVYPVATLRDAPPEADQFVTFLQRDDIAALAASCGFGHPNGNGGNGDGADGADGGGDARDVGDGAGGGLDSHDAHGALSAGDAHGAPGAGGAPGASGAHGGEGTS